ncbi:MAG: MFS transporter, partial [Chloroflexia bacterium]|nr:MFS transporter [Chloroflexia bacterium]
LATAREAFVQGMRLSSGIAAVVAVGLAILAVVTLRTHGAPATEAATAARMEGERGHMT